MKELLWKEGLWEDLIQELHTAALFAWKQGIDEAEVPRCAQRYIYAFLKSSIQLLYDLARGGNQTFAL